VNTKGAFPSSRSFLLVEPNTNWCNILKLNFWLVSCSH
jgi:hypothetical protein